MTEAIGRGDGITKRVIIDWRASTRASTLRPAIVIKDKKGKIGKLRAAARPAICCRGRDPLRRHGQKVKAGDVLARIPTESAKTRDITGGLPRVAELFEARRPKDTRSSPRSPARSSSAATTRISAASSFVPDEGLEPVEYLDPQGQHLAVQEGDHIEKGEFLLDGNPAPHDILAIKGVEELANYLVNEIQEVYRLQGVTINDKHIEVIVRQMLQKTEVTTPATPSSSRASRSTASTSRKPTAAVEQAAKPATGSRFCSASPRPRCRRAPSSRRLPSRRPRACSPKPPSTARSTRSRA